MKQKKSNIMSDVVLALYDNKDPWDIGAKLIKWWTKSNYSHVELNVGNWSYSSSIPDGGVRQKSAVEVYKHKDNWTFVKLPWVAEKDVLAYFDRTSGTGYGWLGLVLGQVLNTRIDGQGDFCSEWVTKALNIVPDAQLFSPEDVFQVCKKLNEVYAIGYKNKSE